MLIRLVLYNIFSTYYTMLAWYVSIMLQKGRSTKENQYYKRLPAYGWLMAPVPGCKICFETSASCAFDQERNRKEKLKQ